MFRLRARDCHPDPRFLQRENLALETQALELQLQLDDLMAENRRLAGQVERLTPRRRENINATQLASTIQGLRTAGECAKLVTATNGPTVFWLTVNRFGVQRPHAELVSSEAHGDWRKAVARLDDYKFLNAPH
jgi:hypothetical protein